MRQEQRTRNESRWRRRILAGLIFVFLVLLFLPWVVSKDPLRDRLLAWLVNDPMISISTQAAGFGYFAPLTVDELQISSADQSVDIRIEKIHAEKSWLAMLMDAPQWGSVTFTHPRLQVILDTDRQQQPRQPVNNRQTGLPVFEAIVERGEIRIGRSNDPEDLLELKDINLSVRMLREHGGSVFAVGPITVLDHEALTPDLCREGLQLVAPLIADQIAMQGSVSLKIDNVRIPVGAASQVNKNELQISGSVALHNVSVELKDDVTRRLVAMSAELFKVEIPDKLLVTENMGVEFHVAGERIHHRGLGMVFPGFDSPISINSSGSVGWDETLDLEITVSGKSGEAPGNRVARYRIRGTIDEPTFESDAE